VTEKCIHAKHIVGIDLSKEQDAVSSTQALRSRMPSPSPLSRTWNKTAANLPRAGRKTQRLP
jgi:hypothetical protein